MDSLKLDLTPKKQSPTLAYHVNTEKYADADVQQSLQKGCKSYENLQGKTKTTSAVINEMISDVLDDEEQRDNDELNNQYQDSRFSEHDFQSCQDHAELASVKLQKICNDEDLHTKNNKLQPCFEIGAKMADSISQNQIEAKSFNDAKSYASFLDDSRSQFNSSNLKKMQSQVDSYSFQQEVSTLSTQNNNSNYKNEFQDIPNFAINYQDYNRNSNARQQPLMVIGIQDLPLNPTLQQFNEQAYYKLKQKELTCAYKSANYNQRKARKDGEKIINQESNLNSDTTQDPNQLAGLISNKETQKDQRNNSWMKNPWNHNPAQYNVHYSQKEFEEDTCQKQNKVFQSQNIDIAATKDCPQDQHNLNHMQSMTSQKNQLQVGSDNQNLNVLEGQIQTSDSKNSVNQSLNQSKVQDTNIQNVQQDKSLRTTVDPLKSYEAQHFQSQNLMLNRDPEFLLKQHLLQQKLIKQYHMERTKLAAQFAAKTTSNNDSVTAQNQYQQNPKNQTEKTNFQQIIYNNFGLLSQSKQKEEDVQERPLMFEKKHQLKIKTKQNDAHQGKENENTSEPAHVLVEKSSLLATSFDNQNQDRAFSEKDKSLSQLQQNFDADQQEDQSNSFQEKPDFVYNSYNQDAHQNQFKSYEPQAVAQFPSYEEQNNYEKPSSLDLAFDEDQSKSKRSIFSGDFGTFSGDHLEDKKEQEGNEWKSQMDVSKDTLSCKSPDFIPNFNWNNDDKEQQRRQLSQKDLVGSEQKFQMKASEICDSDTQPQSKMPQMNENYINSDARSLQNYESQQPLNDENNQRMSNGHQQNSSYKVQNSNMDPQQHRFSNFSDSVTNCKGQKPRSVYDKSDNRSSHTSNLCSSVDPKECIDNLEQMVAGDLNFLENIQTQNNDLMARIGYKINQKVPDQSYDASRFNQGPIQPQMSMQYGNQIPVFTPQPVPAPQNFGQYQQPYNQSKRPHYGIPHQQQQRQNFMPPQANQFNFNTDQGFSMNQVSPHQFGMQSHNGLNQQSTAFIPRDPQTDQTFASSTDGNHGKKATARQIEKIHQLLQSKSGGKSPLLTLDITLGFELDCCKDQKCSRFIQKRLLEDTTSIEERNKFLDSVFKNGNVRFDLLVMDSFGNYVIQKIQQIPGIDIQYLNIIFENIIGNVMRYSTHKHGCRVVQTGFEVFQYDQKQRMMQELLDCKRVKECSFNFNGNHVVQQIIIQMGCQTQSQEMREIIKEIEVHLMDYCVNEFCCRIIQRMIEYCHPVLIEQTNQIILGNFYALCKNEFGIFVLSSILEHGQNVYKDQILQNVQGNAASMSLRKDGSKLVENCMKMVPFTNGGKHDAQTTQLFMILDEVISLPLHCQPSQMPQQHPIFFSDLLTNKFANYVVQTMFEVSDSQRRQVILSKIQYSLKDINNVKDTPLKHILKFLQKHDVYLRGNQLFFGSNSVPSYSNITSSQPASFNAFSQSAPVAPMGNQPQAYAYQNHQYQPSTQQKQFGTPPQMMFNNAQLPYQINQYQQQLPTSGPVPGQPISDGQVSGQFIPQQQLQHLQQYYTAMGGANAQTPQQQQHSIIQNQQQQLVNQFSMLGFQNAGSNPNLNSTQSLSNGHQQNVNSYHY